MILNSLNTIIDDIILTYRNSNINESESLSKIQVEQWIHNYRAMLIKQDIDKGRDVNPQYVQTIRKIKLIKVENEVGHYEYVSEIELPKLIDFHYGIGLVAVKDTFGNIIQLGSETTMKFQKYRKYTCNDYIAYIKENHIYVEGPNYLEEISIDVIAENPADLTDCFDADGPYPVPANLIPTIKDLIFSKELGIMISMPSDNINNSANDLENIQRKTD